MVCFYIVDPKRYHIRTCIHKAINLFKTLLKFSKKKKSKKQTNNNNNKNKIKKPKQTKSKKK